MDAQARESGKEIDALRGGGLLQSREEWDARNRILADTLADLLQPHLRARTGRALDVGCGRGKLTDRFSERISLNWQGVDPDVKTRRTSAGGVELLPGYAHDLPFPDGSFDCVVIANVYEHVSPELRVRTLASLNRVLAPGGILVGQMPNPYFIIESHSRLPFFGYLPRWLQRRYWKLTPTGWDFEEGHFFTVTVRALRRTAEAHGFETELVRNFNYPPEAIPRDLRWAAKIHARLGLMPWAWQYIFRKIQ